MGGRFAEERSEHFIDKNTVSNRNSVQPYGVLYIRLTLRLTLFIYILRLYHIIYNCYSEIAVLSSSEAMTYLCYYLFVSFPQAIFRRICFRRPFNSVSISLPSN